jgi:hypothetical protein
MTLPALRTESSFADPSSSRGDALGVPADTCAALSEYASALRGAGFQVLAIRDEISVWQYPGHGPSVEIVVDGSARLVSRERVGVRGRLAPEGLRPSPMSAVAAARQWILDDRVPDAWIVAS